MRGLRHCRLCGPPAKGGNLQKALSAVAAHDGADNPDDRVGEEADEEADGVLGRELVLLGEVDHARP